MTTSNNFTRLSQAIALLGDTLRPFVERELKRAGGNWWTQYVLPNVSPLSRQRLPMMPIRGSSNQLATADVNDLLRLITRNWNEVFKSTLPPPARSWANELQESRNHWAHKGDGDLLPSLVDRAIDTAALLLDPIDNAAAGSMRELLARTTYSDQQQGVARATSSLRLVTPPVAASRRRAGTYWAIAPFNLETGLVDRAWDYDKRHGTIAIGWGDIPDDISGIELETLKAEMRKFYPQSPGGWQSLWAFYHRIQVDDYVIARTGRSTALGIGLVTSDAYRDDVRGQERTGGPYPWYMPFFRDIKWLVARTEVFNHYVFSIATVTMLRTNLDEVLERYNIAGN